MSNVNYTIEWMDRVGATIHKMLPEGVTVTDKAARDAVYKAFPGYLLFCFCEKYRQQYATHWQAFEGFIPAQLLLIEKHHWLPERAFALTEDDLLLLLHHELLDLRLPSQVHQKLRHEFDFLGIRDLHLNPAADNWTA